MSDLVGYSYIDDEHTRMSYLEHITSLGLLREDGCNLPLNVHLKSFFMLHFKCSFELGDFSPVARDRVFLTPVNPSSPTLLYIKFKAPLKNVLRLTVLYRVHRQLQIDSSRMGFLSHSLEQ